jgi:hypothetical protein
MKQRDGIPNAAGGCLWVPTIASYCDSKLKQDRDVSVARPFTVPLQTGFNTSIAGERFGFRICLVRWPPYNRPLIEIDPGVLWRSANSRVWRISWWFSRRGPNGKTNDWTDWSGNPNGYEGLALDNYLTLLQQPVLNRTENKPSGAHCEPANRLSLPRPSLPSPRYPPSTARSVAVINEASSLNRKRTAAATSQGSPQHSSIRIGQIHRIRTRALRHQNPIRPHQVSSFVNMLDTVPAYAVAC